MQTPCVADNTGIGFADGLPLIATIHNRLARAVLWALRIDSQKAKFLENPIEEILEHQPCDRISTMPRWLFDCVKWGSTRVPAR